MFRSFVYLNEEKMYSYLRQIDSEFANQPNEINKKKTKSGSVGNSIIGINAETEVEERRELSKDITRDYDRFEKQLEKLGGEEYFDFVIDEYDLNTIPNMSIIRVNTGFEIPEEFDMYNLAQNFMPLLTNQIQISNDEEKQLVDTYFGQASADIPIVVELDNFTIAGKLSTRNLKENYEELEEYNEQDVYVLCKVVGKVRKNRVEIFNPLKDFIKIPRVVRRSMDSNNEGLEPIVVDGPVIKVEVIAIYK